MREREAGELIEVGDTIVTKHGFGEKRHVVHRVTATRAYVWWNSVAEGAYERKVGDFGRVAPYPRSRVRFDAVRHVALAP